MEKPMRSNQNLRVSWKPVNPQDCVWENLYRIIMKTILQERRTIHCNIIIWYTKFIPVSQAMKTPAAKAAVDKEWEKLAKIPAWDLTKVRSRSEVIDEVRTKGAKVHFASLMDICHLKNAQIAYLIYEYFRVTGAIDSVENYADYVQLLYSGIRFEVGGNSVINDENPI